MQPTPKKKFVPADSASFEGTEKVFTSSSKSSPSMIALPRSLHAIEERTAQKKENSVERKPARKDTRPLTVGLGEK